MRATDTHRAPVARRPRAGAGSDFTVCLARELARNGWVDLHTALRLLACRLPPEPAVKSAALSEPTGRAA